MSNDFVRFDDVRELVVDVVRQSGLLDVFRVGYGIGRKGDVKPVR